MIAPRKPRVVAAVVVAAPLLALACASIVGIDPPHDRPADAGGTDGGGLDATVDATLPSNDASPTDNDTGTPPDTGANPPLPDASEDAGCAPPPDATKGAFVNATGGQDGPQCGTAQAPCATIQQGILRAQALAVANVFVAQGNYFGPIALVKGITVQGGFAASGGTWSALCAPQAIDAVVVSGSNQDSVTVTAQNLGGAAALDTLTVLSKPAASVTSGETVYGIVAQGTTTTLALNNVIVRIAAGGSGTPGAPGAAGGVAADDGGCGAGTGAPGTAGGAGTEAPVGMFVDGGYVWSAGSVGQTGNAGGNGTAGGAGLCPPDVTACYCGPGIKCTVGQPGVCGENGLSGCGGPGGTGGTPGGGGGSSVAVLVSGATLTGTGGIVQASNGGAGGGGGDGGAGGTPTEGAHGASGTCETTCSCVPSFCCIPGGPVGYDGGSAGGQGGAGGAGGQGAGGAGGWSCAYAVLADASVAWAGTKLLFGDAGSGGAPNGPSGQAQEKCP